jgi:hypothetical protein
VLVRIFVEGPVSRAGQVCAGRVMICVPCISVCALPFEVEGQVNCEIHLGGDRVMILLLCVSVLALPCAVRARCVLSE